MPEQSEQSSPVREINTDKLEEQNEILIQNGTEISNKTSDIHDIQLDQKEVLEQISKDFKSFMESYFPTEEELALLEEETTLADLDETFSKYIENVENQRQLDLEQGEIEKENDLIYREEQLSLLNDIKLSLDNTEHQALLLEQTEMIASYSEPNEADLMFAFYLFGLIPLGAIVYFFYKMLKPFI